MCPRKKKIQFQGVSGHFGFITCNKFQAAVLLINIQRLCVCAFEKWIILFPFLHVTGVSAKAQGSGERLGMTFKTQTFHLFLLLCFVLLFFFLKMSPGECVETDEYVTACLGWLEEREMPSVV